MSITRKDLVVGAKLECIAARANRTYTIGNIYEVTREPDGKLDDDGEETVELQDNQSSGHHWSVESLCRMEHNGVDYSRWHTRFELANV